MDNYIWARNNLRKPVLPLFLALKNKQTSKQKQLFFFVCQPFSACTSVGVINPEVGHVFKTKTQTCDLHFYFKLLELPNVNPPSGIIALPVGRVLNRLIYNKANITWIKKKPHKTPPTTTPLLSSWASRPNQAQGSLGSLRVCNVTAGELK